MYLASIADQQAGKGAKQVNQNMQINPTQQTGSGYPGQYNQGQMPPGITPRNHTNV